MYIPKNRIKPNLYTRGNEYVIKETGENYVGYYHQLYTGKSYTGKTPNDKPIREIIAGGSTTDQLWEATSEDPSNGEGFQQYSSNYDGVFENKSETSMADLDTYHQVKNVNFRDVKLLPQQFYPRPTKDDYDLGTFTRYFVIKVNEVSYVEIDETTYKKLTNQDPKWAFELYTPFKIQWTLTGDKVKVYETNKNIVLIESRRLKRPGLNLFLRDNYLQFYQN